MSSEGDAIWVALKNVAATERSLIEANELMAGMVRDLEARLRAVEACIEANERPKAGEGD